MELTRFAQTITFAHTMALRIVSPIKGALELNETRN